MQIPIPPPIAYANPFSSASPPHVRRICVFGGPGVGKSTFTARLFSELKARQYNVELVSEFVKTWAHEGRKPTSYDQYFIHANQLHAEDLVLRHVPVIVTDSPLPMNVTYSSFYKFPACEPLVEMTKVFERQFLSLNIVLKRTVDYVEAGRYQNRDEAVEFDNFLTAFLEGKFPELLCYESTVDMFDRVLDFVIRSIPHAKIRRKPIVAPVVDQPKKRKIFSLWRSK